MIRRFCDWCSKDIGNTTDDYAPISYPPTFNEAENMNSDDICFGCYEQLQQLIKVRKEKSAKENDNVS